MKMYILIRSHVPLGFAINSAAHASLGCYVKYKDDPDMIEWLENSFKKVTCKVNDAELRRTMISNEDFVEITEGALDGQLVAVAFKPRKEWPKCFKHLCLYK